MEMQLSTSGALSRSHYALVQRVEHATSPQEIDLVVLREVADIRHRLSKTGVTSVKCLCLWLLHLF
jgi:AP-4 complex subunit epsilon-1